MRHKSLKSGKKRLEVTPDRGLLLTEPSFLKNTHVNHLMSQIVKHVLDEMEISCCGIWLLDKSYNFMPRMVFGIKEELYAMTHSARFTRMLRCVVRRKKYIMIQRLSGLKDKDFKKMIRKEGVRSLIAYPLLVNDMPIGVLVVCLRKGEGAFTKFRIKIGSILAANTSLLLKNIYLYKNSINSSMLELKNIAKVMDITKMLALLAEAKDRYTHGHSERVVKCCVEICKRLNLSKKEMLIIKEAAILHDLGKIAIDNTILHKKGPLTEKEWQEIKKHPVIGARIIEQTGLVKDVVLIVKYHHERFSGGGYPDPDIKKEEIPLGARIIAVADAYAAMSSDRSYRKALPKKKIVQELKEYSGTQFDPQVVKAMLSMI